MVGDDAPCDATASDRFRSTTTAQTGTTFCVQFNESGTWPYQCTVGSHGSRGMPGTVEVE